MNAAVRAAARRMGHHLRRTRRDARLSAVIHGTVRRLVQLVIDHRNGDIGTLQFVDAATKAMHDGYAQAMHAGSEDASGDYPDTPVQSFDAEAAARAERQQGFIMNLLKESSLSVVKAPTDDPMDLDAMAARFMTYGETLVGSYNAAFGQTVENAHPDYTIVWELGEAEHCDLCLDRDGKEFTFDTLPGWPGDGNFGGDLCEGGPRCACTLSYHEGGQALAEGGNTQREDALGYYDGQNADITARRDEMAAARDEFVSSLPGSPDDLSTAQGRAYQRDDIREAMADAANAAIRQGGGYQGVTVEPSDIPATLVAAAKAFNPNEPRDAQGRWTPGGTDKPTYENTGHMTDEELGDVLSHYYATDPSKADAIEQIINEREARGVPATRGRFGNVMGESGARASGGLTSNRMKEGAAQRYDEYAQTQYNKALADLNGVLLNKAGQAYSRSGHGGLEYMLFRMPWKTAEKYASEELKQWWLENGRETHSSFRYGMNGWAADRASAEAVRLRGHSRTALASTSDRSQQ